MDDVRSWVVSKEENIYFTKKNSNTLFAIVIRAYNTEQLWYYQNFLVNIGDLIESDEII